MRLLKRRFAVPGRWRPSHTGGRQSRRRGRKCAWGGGPRRVTGRLLGAQHKRKGALLRARDAPVCRVLHHEWVCSRVREEQSHPDEAQQPHHAEHADVLRIPHTAESASDAFQRPSSKASCETAAAMVLRDPPAHREVALAGREERRNRKVGCHQEGQARDDVERGCGRQ